MSTREYSELVVPLQVLGRNHRACLRCKNIKVKCSGERPACEGCLQHNLGAECTYPQKDRKVIILQSQLELIRLRVAELEAQAAGGGTSSQTDPLNATPQGARVTVGGSLEGPLPVEETFNPLLPHSDRVGSISCQVFDHALETFLGDYGGIDDTHSSSARGSATPEAPDFYLDDAVLSLRAPGTLVPLPERGYAAVLLETVRNFNREYYFFDYQAMLYRMDEFYQGTPQAQGASGGPRAPGRSSMSSAALVPSYEMDPSQGPSLPSPLPAKPPREVEPLALCHFLCLLAIGEQCRNGSLTIQERKQYPGLEFFVSAIQLFHMNTEEITPAYVQCVLCLGFFSQTLNRSNTAYGYYGLAMRLSLVLGLHRKQEDTSERSKRIWWTVFVLDSLWALKIGMPVHIEIGMTDVALPLEAYEDLNDGFEIGHLHENVNVCQYIGKIVRKVYSPPWLAAEYRIGAHAVARPPPTLMFTANTLECLNDLLRLEITCEEYTQSIHQNGVLQIHSQLSRGVVNLYLRYNHLVILTTRPLALAIFKKTIPETPETRLATTRCIISACHNIDALSNLKNFGQLTTGFWDGQHCFSAVLILIMASLSANHYLPYIYKGVDILAFLAKRGNINAKSHFNRLTELDRLLERVAEKNQSFNLTLRLASLSLDTAHSPKSDELMAERGRREPKAEPLPDWQTFFLPHKGLSPAQSSEHFQTVYDMVDHPHFTYESPDFLNGLDYLVDNIEGWVKE